MLVPISWLKDFVIIDDHNLKDLMWRMTEVGMTTENYKKVGDDTVLDVEVTPNRPDWLSIIGVARELASLQNKEITPPELWKETQANNKLPLKVNNDFELCPRYTAIIIQNVKQLESPKWMQDRLTLSGLRPINNLVDITNYVMLELGNPIHVFDYDKIIKAKMILKKSAGGEKFTSVDEKSYTLPKDVIIFESGGEVIDLCGIKGGFNSGITSQTKNILILVAIYNGKLIRKTSQAMKLSSEASHIFERGANTGGTKDTLKRVVKLIKELAGGEIASEIIDNKKESFEPWKLNLNLEKLESVLGIKLTNEKVTEILKRLNLSPMLEKGEIICTIPTYRGDLKIEEDLIEEVARLYGYNNFPKTLPSGTTSEVKVPYYYDRDFEMLLKNLMVASGFYEANTLSLISEELINSCQIQKDNLIKIANPVSSDYEYLRNSLIPSLLLAVKLNSNEKTLRLFEYNKVFEGPVGNSTEEKVISIVIKGFNFRDIKGMLDLISERLNLPELETKPSQVENGIWHPTKSGVIEHNEKILGFFGEIHPKVLLNLEIKEKVYAIELFVDTLKSLRQDKIYSELPKFPAQIEDITLEIPTGIEIGKVIKLIKSSDKLVETVNLTDIYQNSYTFRVSYQNPDKTLTDKEVKDVRNKILSGLKKEYLITPKK